MVLTDLEQFPKCYKYILLNDNVVVNPNMVEYFFCFSGARLYTVDGLYLPFIELTKWNLCIRINYKKMFYQFCVNSNKIFNDKIQYAFNRGCNELKYEISCNYIDYYKYIEKIFNKYYENEENIYLKTTDKYARDKNKVKQLKQSSNEIMLDYPNISGWCFESNDIGICLYCNGKHALT